MVGPDSVEEAALPVATSARRKTTASGPSSFAAALEACPPSSDYVELLKKEVGWCGWGGSPSGLPFAGDVERS